MTVVRYLYGPPGGVGRPRPGPLGASMAELPPVVAAAAHCLRRLCMDNKSEMKVFFNSFSYSNSSLTPWNKIYKYYAINEFIPKIWLLTKSFTSSSLNSLTRSSMSFKIWDSSLVVRSSSLRPRRAWLTICEEWGKPGTEKCDFNTPDYLRSSTFQVNCEWQSKWTYLA